MTRNEKLANNNKIFGVLLDVSIDFFLLLAELHSPEFHKMDFSSAIAFYFKLKYTETHKTASQILCQS